MADTIALSQLPADYALPGVYIELDASEAGGQADESAPWLILCQKLSTGEATSETEYRIPSKSEAVRLFGEGSIGAQMCEAYLSNDQLGGRDLRARGIPDAAGATQATADLIVDVSGGSAPSSGELAVYVGGRRVPVSVSAGDSGSTVATAITTAITAAKDLAATATADTSSATLKMTDDDNAATTGKALYCAAVSGSNTLGTLNADNTGGSADTTVTLSDATTLAVTDNDASGAGAVDGTAVYYDETNDRLVAAFADGRDRYVLTSDDDAIGVYAVSSVSGHIAVYFDDDAAVATDKVLFVATDNADATAALVTAYVRLTARHGGTVPNALDLRHSHNIGESAPSGVGIGIKAFAGGATDPSITDLISALGDSPYDAIIHPWPASTQLDALDTEMVRRWGATVGVMGHTMTGTVGSAATMEALGDSENDRYLTLWGAQSSPTPPWELAAAAAGAIRSDLQTSVGVDGTSYTVPKDVKGKALKGVTPPAPGDDLTNEEANALIVDGVAPLRRSGGDLRVVLFTTNEQTDENGQATTRYRHALHVYDDMAIHRALKSALSGFLSGKRVTTDETTSAPNTVTLKDIERVVDTVFYALQRAGLVENATLYVANRKVTKPSANRVAVLFPPDRTNPIDQLGVVHQPRLDY